MLHKIIIFLLVLTTLNACLQQQSPLTEAEVVAVIVKFDSGWQHKNIRAVDAALAKEYTYFTQSGGIFSRDSVVATSGESDYLLEDMSRSNLEIVIRGNTAVVGTRWKGKGTYRGTRFDEDQRCSIVVVKKDNVVQILSEHCTPIRAKRIFH